MQRLLVRLLRSYFVIGGAIAPSLMARQAFLLFCTPLRKPQLRPGHLDLLARAEAFTVPFRGGALRAFRWRSAGRPSTAPRVLLMHGWESRAAQLGKWVDPLLARGFEVVAFDGPAHGESSGRRASLPDFVAAIGAVAAEAGPFEAIVGHSLGAGASAIAVAGAHLTGLPAVPVDRLVLVAGPDRALDFFRQFAAMMGLNDRVFAGFLAQIEAIGGRSVEAYSTAAVLASCATPVFVIHDRDDEMIPAATAEAIAAASQASRLLITEGLGHHRIVSDPAVIDEAVDCIAGGAAATTRETAVA